MAYTIGEKCTGCGLCAKKCPAKCISGEKKQRHVIDAAVCFDCGVCASYCPVSCLTDTTGAPTKSLKPKERPVAAVDITFCSGCEACIDLCPFGCIEMVQDETTQTLFAVAKVTNPKDCVGCRLCVNICSQKEAITLRRPDGSLCQSLSDHPSIKKAI